MVGGGNADCFGMTRKRATAKAEEEADPWRDDSQKSKGNGKYGDLSTSLRYGRDDSVEGRHGRDDSVAGRYGRDDSVAGRYGHDDSVIVAMTIKWGGELG
jgi:hypothetical protein